MNRKLGMVSLVLILAATVAAAQQASPAQPPPGAVLAHYLQLSAEQKTAWQAAHKEFADATRPLVENQRALNVQLQTAMQGTDGCAIGNLMLQIRGIGDQIHAAHEALETKLVNVLTPEQKTKYEAFKAAAEFLRHAQQAQAPRP